MKKCIIAVALAALVAQPTLAQSQPNLLGELIKAIGKKKADNAGSGSSTALNPGGAGAFVVAMSAEQKAALQKALDAKVANPDVARDITEARSLIDKLVSIGACATSTAAWNAVNAQSERPRTRDNRDWQTVVGGSQYHDKRYCFDVQRVGDWSKPAKNALTFSAYYVSSQSGEAGVERFTLIKNPEGQWLVRSAGLG